MTEYLVPFEIRIFDYLTVGADTPGTAAGKVESHLLSHKDGWGKLSYSLDIKDPAPVEPKPEPNIFHVTQFVWANRSSAEYLVEHFDLDWWFNEVRFRHGLVAETAQGDPVAIAWIDVQFEDAHTGAYAIGWVHFRVCPPFVEDADTILLQCVDSWAEHEPQLHLFASYLHADDNGLGAGLHRLGWKHAGMGQSRLATEYQPEFVVCHRAGDQVLALEMAKLRA